MERLLSRYEKNGVIVLWCFTFDFTELVCGSGWRSSGRKGGYPFMYLKINAWLDF